MDAFDPETLYDLVVDAVRSANEDPGSGRIQLSRRLIGGTVIFKDDQDRVVKEIPAESLFRKVTAIREKLRVLEQKLNNHPGLDATDQAEMQGYITRVYGSLTTFNFLFRDEDDKFKGVSGE